MHVILGLFLLGAIIMIAMFVFQAGLTVIMGTVTGIVAGCMWVVERIRGK